MPESTASKGWTLALRSAGADTLEIVVYDMIGKDPLFGDGFGAADFLAHLRGAPQAKKISLRINSVGGYLDDAKSMVNLLRERESAGVDIEAHVDGLAASAASYLLTAAKRVIMPSNAFIMLHEVRCVARGRASDLETAANVVRLDNSIAAEAYAAASARRGKKKTKDEYLAAMASGDVYLTAAEAIEWGLADEQTASIKTAACLSDIGSLSDAPEELRRAPYVVRPEARADLPAATPQPAAQQPPITTPEAPQPPAVEKPTARATGQGTRNMPDDDKQQPPAATEPTSVMVSGVKLLGVATEAEAHAKISDLTKLNMALMSATGASSNAEALARVMAWKSGSEHATELVKQVDELKSKATASQKEASIQKLSREGKLAPAMHDWARANFASAEALETFALALPPMVTIGAHEPTDPTKAVTLTADDKLVIAQLGISEELYIEEKKHEMARNRARTGG